MDQLLTLLSSKPNEQLHATTTLLIGNCDWLDGKSVFIPSYGVTTVSPIIERRTFLQGVVETALRTFAKLRLYVPISQFNLPNVSYVVYVVYFIPEQTPNVSQMEFRDRSSEVDNIPYG